MLTGLTVLKVLTGIIMYIYSQKISIKVKNGINGNITKKFENNCIGNWYNHEHFRSESIDKS